MKIYAKFLIIILLFTLLAACAPVRVASEIPVIPDGQVVGLQMGSVIHGIKQVGAEKAGTKVLTDGSNYVLRWTTAHSANFACFSAQGTGCVKSVLETIKAGGNAANVKTVNDLEKFLLENGYKAISPQELPDAIKVIFSTSIQQVLRLVQNWGTFLIIPAGIFDIPAEYQPQVKEIG